MARKQTKCSTCGDILFFLDESGRRYDVPQAVGQSVTCTCGETTLTEAGPVGNFTTLLREEREGIMDAIDREDLRAIRLMFDARGIPRPQHSFRWSKADRRWEVSRVRPVNRTLIAYRQDGEWVEV